jgi:hypothetical protein
MSDLSKYENALKALQILNPNYSIKAWYYDRVWNRKDVESIKRLDFYKEVVTDQLVPISPELFIGSLHDSFNQGTWLEGLALVTSDGKGFRNLTREKFMSILAANEAKGNYPTIISYGNQYFIEGGNHRRFIAKFLELESIMVRLTSFEFDAKAYTTHQTLVKLQLLGTTPSFSFEASNWNLQLKNCNLTITKEGDLVEQFIKFYNGLQPLDFFDKIMMQLLGNAKPHKNHGLRITSTKDFLQIRRDCILHKFQE